MKAIVGTAALLMAAAAPAGAETFDASGVMMGMTEMDMHAISETEQVVGLKTRYEEVSMENPDNPMNGMTGDCIGATFMSETGVSGSGWCAYIGEGGSMVVSWTADGRDGEGAMTGQWQLVSGIGNWDGASGSGSFASLVDPEAGTSRNTVTGEIDIP